MLDPTQPTPASPNPSQFQPAARAGAVGRIITDEQTITRTLDRPRERAANPWDQAGQIEARDAATARAARTEARRQLFAIAGELDKAEKDLAAARTAGNPARIADAERAVAVHAAKLSEQAKRTNELTPGNRETLTPERVFALLAWKQAPAADDQPASDESASL